MNDSFVYYKSFVDAMEILSVQEYGEVSKAINRYAIYGEEPDDLSPMAKIVFIMAKPQIDANSERRTNGSKGGRPKKDNKETIGFENEKPLVFENDNQGFENEKPNVNVNVNANANDNANDNANVNDNIPPISPQGENRSSKKTREIKPTETDIEIIDYLNFVCDKSFRPSKSNIEYIHGRLSEGYTIDDFKKVIDIKAEKWKNNPDMNEYLRPSTLFAPKKFDNYLNEKPKTNTSIKDKWGLRV